MEFEVDVLQKGVVSLDSDGASIQEVFHVLMAILSVDANSP